MTCHECPLEEATTVAIDIARDNRSGLLSSSQRHQKVVALTARSAVIEHVAQSCDGPTETGSCASIQKIALIEQSVLSPETVLQDLLAQDNTAADTSQVNQG